VPEAEPGTPAAAEELEAELIRDNMGRMKTQVMVAREMRHMLELEKRFARRRMGMGSDGGESKSADRVAQTLNERSKAERSNKSVSGKTVQRQVTVLNAIEKAEADGDKKKAERLSELLNNKNIVKALELARGKAAKAKKPVKVEVPPTLHSHLSRMYSEGFEACAKATCSAEVDLIDANIERVRKDAEAARRRVGG
jgi:regulator of replication initiation timing